ncbi:acetyl-CoA carboxylase biotin carboxyl carrier protein [Ferruginibacter yonginensis]|uniref:Biotin carboxyl carrier protein of acetyl-CoA carboxylase n=1 Tax=Ferruginibacter yonginensis TaxID=1310416 RepID=A0ABV8QRI6_9BACT
MDIKQIQELVKLINKTSIGEITIEEDGTKITIKQKKDPSQKIYTQAAPANYSAPAAAPAVPTPTAAAPAAAQAAPAAAPKADNLITIKSPMIGTFYRQAGPEKPLFVNVGDEVAPGKVVCIIEAMKLFNEIESEVKGTIVKVLVDDASPVEYDQPLFLVEPA